MYYEKTPTLKSVISFLDSIAIYLIALFIGLVLGWSI